MRVVIKEKEEFSLKLIARGKLTIAEVAVDLELPLERVKELARLQLV